MATDINRGNLRTMMSDPAPKDWTLLAIASARGQPLTPVQLQKSLFLLSKKQPVQIGANFNAFEPYDYGPFSKQIYVDADELEAEGLIARVAHPRADWKDYVILPLGTKQAGKLAKSGPTKAIEYLAKLVEWSSRLTFPQLVHWIYTNYPEYKVNSVFAD